MTKQEFIQRYQISMRTETRRLRNLAIITVVILAPAMICAPLIINYLNRTDYFDWAASINEYSLRGVAGCFVLAMAFASSRLSHPYGVPCQACGENLSRNSARLALITGNCGFCGEKVLEDGGSGSADMLKSLKLYD